MTKENTSIEKAFERDFSFEGNNDPEDTPKMLFVIHDDGTKSIARPEYVIAFARQCYFNGYEDGQLEKPEVLPSEKVIRP